MRGFWPSFFLFLSVVALAVGRFRPDLAELALAFLGAYLALVAYALLACAGVAFVVVLVVVYRRQDSNIMRPVDGALPVVRQRLRGGRVLLLDLNKSISAAVVVDPVLGPVEVPPAAGYDRQFAYVADVEQSNRVRAAFPGDAARSDPHGARSGLPRWDVARGLHGARPEAGALGARIKALPLPNAAPSVALRPLTLAEAVQQATARSLAAGLVVGGDGANGIVRWRLDQAPHGRIHGQSQGAGKTNLAKVLLLGAAYAGGHLVIVDRRRFKDWAGWGRVAELVDGNDPQALLGLLQRLVDLYRQRDRVLGQAGVGQIADLPAEYGPLPRVFVLLAEFGALCQSLAVDGHLDGAQHLLGLLLRESAAAGVHLLFEDQIVDRRHWPRAVAANAGAVFTGRLPVNLGAAGGYYGAHDLPAYSFHYDGAILRPWLADPAALAVLPARPHPEGTRLQLAAGDAPSGHPPGVHDPGSLPVPGVVPGVVSGVVLQSNGGGDLKWRQFTADWLAARPDLHAGGTNDLARAMAQQDGLPVAEYTRFKGIASRMLALVRSAAHGAGLPDGGAQ